MKGIDDSIEGFMSSYFNLDKSLCYDTQGVNYGLSVKTTFSSRVSTRLSFRLVLLDSY